MELRYNIESKSGKVYQWWHDHVSTLRVYKESEYIDENTLFYCVESGTGKPPFQITQEDFLTIHNPLKMWRVGFGGNYYIEPRLKNLITIIENAIENENEDDLEIERINMSQFELSMFPEFEGF